MVWLKVRVFERNKLKQNIKNEIKKNPENKRTPERLDGNSYFKTNFNLFEKRAPRINIHFKNVYIFLKTN